MFRERATAEGWQLKDTWRASGGVQLFFERGGTREWSPSSRT
jgi:hypothetical protein